MKNTSLFSVLIAATLIITSALHPTNAVTSQSNTASMKQSVFVGNWVVTKVDFPENYFSEIKYPVSFQLTATNSEEKHGSAIKAQLQITGTYKDQFDYQSDFSLAQIINNGNELLLLLNGSTKHSGSWAPLNKVKFINGQLVGLVITNHQRFIWYAEPEKIKGYISNTPNDK